jgi:hypothetical protein
MLIKAYCQDHTLFLKRFYPIEGNYILMSGKKARHVDPVCPGSPLQLAGILGLGNAETN